MMGEKTQVLKWASQPEETQQAPAGPDKIKGYASVEMVKEETENEKRTFEDNK